MTNPRRGRAHARVLYALLQTVTDEDLARWSETYDKDRRLSPETLVRARELLVLVAETLEDADQQSASARIGSAKMALEGGTATTPASDPTPANQPSDPEPAPGPEPAPAAFPPVPVRVVAAPIWLEGPSALALLSPPHETAAADRAPPSAVSPWAKNVAVRPTLEPLAALAVTQDAPSPTTAPPLPFSGTSGAPPSSPSLEQVASLGGTLDVPGLASRAALPFQADAKDAQGRGPDDDLEQYAWLCAQAPPGQAHATTSSRPVLDDMWNARFKADFALQRRFRKLVAEYRQRIAHGERGGGDGT